MSEPTTAVVKKEDKMMEYIPFGTDEAIKLSIQIVKDLICVKTKSGKVCSDNDAIKYMMMNKARKLNPFEGDSFLIGYDNRDGGATFSLITAHQAFLKRAERHPEFDGMKSGIIIQRDEQVVDIEGDFHLPTDKVLGGWATVYFKNRKHPMHKRVRLGRFKKSFGIWLEDEAGMICKCAEADALRSSFPTMLGGLYMKEEIEHDSPIKTATPIFKEAEITSEPAPAPAKVSDLEYLRGLCKKDKVDEATLVKFMIEIGLVDDENFESLDSIAADHPDKIGLVIEQWADFSSKIKEVSNV